VLYQVHGKSTLAKQLVSKAEASGNSAIICSADEYFYNLGGGTYKHDFNKIADAHKFCFKKFMQAIKDDVNLIIVDNTNLSAWEISPYKMYAETHDYDVKITQVNSDPNISFSRQQHGVPEQAHKRMSDSLNKEFIPPWWNKEIKHSKTSDTGEPIFEDDMKKDALIKQLLKIAKTQQAALKKLANLDPPATEEEIKDVERLMTHPDPDSKELFYRR